MAIKTKTTKTKKSAKRTTHKSSARLARKSAIAISDQTEMDTVYFLKIVIFLILGSQWIFVENLPHWQIPIPVGLILGIVFAAHDKFEIDRKIEYFVIIIAAFVAFWLPMGLIIQI